MHVGPYDQVGAAYARIHEAAAERGLVLVGPGHEVYLSDPRRVAAARLRTVVRVAARPRRAR